MRNSMDIFDEVSSSDEEEGQLASQESPALPLMSPVQASEPSDDSCVTPSDRADEFFMATFGSGA